MLMGADLILDHQHTMYTLYDWATLWKQLEVGENQAKCLYDLSNRNSTGESKKDGVHQKLENRQIGNSLDGQK